MKQRKNLFELSSSDRQQLYKLQVAFLANGINSQYPPISLSRSEFLLENRRYVQEMEAYLKRNGGEQFLPLPVWVPSMPIPSEFQAMDGKSVSEGAFMLVPEFFSKSNVHQYLSAADLGHALNSWVVKVLLTLGENISYDQISTMPIFWNLSAYIDSVFAMYQEPAQRKERSCCCCCCGNSGDSGKACGEVILFEHTGFRGLHKHVYRNEPNLNDPEDYFFNDRISSFVILEGIWEFYQHSNYLNPYVVLGPGLYPDLKAVGIENDQISSLRCSNKPPMYPGRPVSHHAILFEHRDLRGAHKHVFQAMPNLNDPEELFSPAPFPPGNVDFFNDKTSSFAILLGDWAFFEHANYMGIQYGNSSGNVYGLGLFPWVGAVMQGSPNDKISSLRPATSANPVLGIPWKGQSVLFMHAFLRGWHKHVFMDEPNLNVAEDNLFNDRVSSIAVREGSGIFYTHASFAGAAVMSGITLIEYVEDIGLANDSISSVKIL